MTLGRVGSAGALNIYKTDAWVTDNALVIEPHISEFLSFLGYFFQTINWPELHTGSTQPLITQTLVKALEIQLPPLTEQRRIVAKVEALLARVNAARARLAEVPALLKRFRQSVLAAACSGRLTEDWRKKNTNIPPAKSSLDELAKQTGPTQTRRGVPEQVPLPSELERLDLPRSWALASAAELLRKGAFVDLKDGNHGANHPKVVDFTKTGLPFITAAQVNDYKIDYEGAYKVSGKALERLRVGFAEVDDVILTHKGSVGRTALNSKKCVLTPQTTYYRCNGEIILPCYLTFYFASLQYYSQLANVMSQTTRDFVPISEQYLLFTILPPREEQAEIVRRVEALFRVADGIEAQVKLATARVEKITQAILAKAFRGELVPTEAELAAKEGRDYEPASALLARIQAQRATQDAALAKPARKPRGRPRKKKGK